MQEKPVCATCTVPMVKGYVGDYSQAGFLPERWFEPIEIRKSLLGFEFFKFPKKQNPMKTGLIVCAWRCSLCGRLDFFALEDD